MNEKISEKNKPKKIDEEMQEETIDKQSSTQTDTEEQITAPTFGFGKVQENPVEMEVD